MAPASKTRESLNINEILENTDPDKLIQFIRAKRNRPVNKNIFCDPTNNSPSNRGSFPIQVEVNKPVAVVATKIPAHTNRDSSSDNDPQANENSANVANAIPTTSKVKTNEKKIEDKQPSIKRSMLPRLLTKLPPNIVARRALHKTFDDIHNGLFLPSVASTPVQRSIPNDPFGSTISNINVNSPENMNEDIASNCNRNQFAAQPQRRITLNRTQVGNESMEIEELRPALKSTRTSLVPSIKNKTIQDEGNQLEKMTGQSRQPSPNYPPEGNNDNKEPVEEVSPTDVPVNPATPVQEQDIKSLSQQRPRRQSNEIINEALHRRQSTERPINFNRSNPLRNPPRSINRRYSQSSVGSQNPPNAHQTNLNRSNNLNNLDNIVSAMVAKIRKSIEQQPILAPPTPFRVDQPPSPRDLSVTIPPTQSQSFPVTSPTSPMVIIPMFAPAHCNQRHSNSSHVEQTRNVPNAHMNVDTVSQLRSENRSSILGIRNSGAKRSHLKVSFPIDNVQMRSPNSSPAKTHYSQQNKSAIIDLTSDESNNVASSTRDGGNAVHRANLSTKTVQRRAENESRASGRQIEQPRLTAYENAQASDHSESPIKRKNIDHSLLEFQVTSDESDSISGATSNQNTVEGAAHVSKGFLASNEPNEAIDLRLSCRRSANFKELTNAVGDSYVIGRESSVPSHPSSGSLVGKPVNMDSPEVSLSGILKLDEMLKKINNTGSDKSAETINRNVTPLPDEVEPSINSQTNRIQEGFNEDILDPMQAESGTRGGYVCDMPPETGKRWMNSFIKNGTKARTLAGAKRGRRVISDKSPASNAVTYDDIEYSMLRQKKRKNMSPRTSRQRRLYSKGHSLEENSSDEDESRRNNTTCQSISCKSSRPIYDKKTKNLKPQKRPVPMKFYTIKDRVESWDLALSKARNEQTEQDRLVAPSNTDDDENLFKVPQPLSIKRKIVPQRIQNVKKQKINLMVAVSRPESQNEGGDNSDSGHSSSSIFTIRSSRSIHTQTPDDTIPSKTKAENQTRETVPVLETHNSEVTRNSSSGLSINSSRTKRDTPRDNCQYEEKQEECPQLEVRASSSPLPIQGDPYESAAERPAEPEVNSEINSSSALISRMTKTPKSTKVHKKSNVKSSKDDSTARDMVLNDWASDNDRLSPGNTEQVENVEHVEMLSEVPVSKGRHTNKENNSSSLSKKKSVSGRQKKSKNKTVSSKTMSIMSPKSSISRDDTTADSSALRRSSRKPAPLRPYWTSRKDLYEIPVLSYKENNLQGGGPEKKRKNGSKKKNQRLEVIAEQSHIQAPVQSSDVVGDADNPPPSTSAVGSNDQAENMFQAIKEMSINKEPKIAPSSSKSKKKTGKKQFPKKPISRTTNGTEGIILTDSGVATDTNNETNQANSDILLSWLKNLIEPTTITSNPDLSRILHQSAITVVPAQNLEFHSIDGVDYAYYDSGVGTCRNYGYMRFHPQSSKPTQRTKLFELRLLNIFGDLHMTTEKEVLVLRNGDFVTVPKGERYALANKSDKIALLFYIKQPK